MNQKGGVGKTTTSLNFSFALSQFGKQILLIDTDPQGHLGNSFGLVNSGQGLDQILLEQQSATSFIQPVRDRIDLICAGARLGEMETRTLDGGIDRGYRLKQALEEIRTAEKYDYIIIDCPPSSGLLGMNAILASDEMLIPVTGDYLALQGLSRLIQVIRVIEKKMHKQIKKWFVLTRFHTRRKLAREIREKLVNYFPGQVLQTAIRESVALAESPGFGKSIFEYQPNSNGSEDYRALADDFLNNRTL